MEEQRGIHLAGHGLGFLVEGGHHDDFPDIELLAAGELFLLLFAGLCGGSSAGVDGQAQVARSRNDPVGLALQFLFFSEIDDLRHGQSGKVPDVCIGGIGQMGGSEKQAAADAVSVLYGVSAQVPCIHDAFYGKKLLGEDGC